MIVALFYQAPRFKKNSAEELLSKVYVELAHL